MVLHAATITLSAFLLFLVQPIIARAILPWFGGSSSVWTISLVFFQVALLAGYFYSDLLVRRVGRRGQAIVHTTLLLASLTFLPITPDPALAPQDAGNPTGQVLLLLAVTIGLPYLMLATTGPLVQAWFNRSYGQARVYRLYALSNLASLGALVLYPPLIEPAAGSRAQAVGWSIAYGVFAVLAIVAAWYGLRRPAGAVAETASTAGPPAADLPTPESPERTPATTKRTGPTQPPSLADQALWGLLAALGSVLLLSVTTHLTQNVASVPFLWVLPLGIYLITFILCFDGRSWYWRPQYMLLGAMLTVLMALGMSFAPTGEGFERGPLHIEYAVPLYSFGLFTCCMFLHGELVERKPDPAHLTRFFLMVSAGGAAGGLAVGILAPWLFSSYWELPLALLAVALLIGALTGGRLRAAGVVAMIGCAIAIGDQINAVRADSIERSRSFYGTLRVKTAFAGDEMLARRRLIHGVILHGEQFERPQWRGLPTTYYGTTSGVGRTLETLMQEGPLRVGLIGLGVGTLAAYGRAGDTYRFYEIDPAVLDLAQRHFSYLSDSPARIETALGDARLVLTREAPQRLDVLAVDAFSSDSIPVHLITREAMQIWTRHLAPQGAIVFHISNRYLDLSGVVARLASEAAMQAVRIIDDPGDGSHLYRSDWVVVTANPALGEKLLASGGRLLEATPSAAAWTDDHHNLFKVLK